MKDAAQPTGEPFRLGRVVALSFGIWRQQLLVLVALVLVVHVPRVVSVEALARLPLPVYSVLLVAKWVATTLVDALFRDLSVAPVVFAVYARLQGRDARLGESLSGGLRRFRPVLGVSLRLALFSAMLSGAAAVALVFLVGSWDTDFARSVFLATNIAFPVLVTLLLSPFWVAVPAAVVETRGLRRSWSLTSGHRVAVCAILVLLHGIGLGTRWTVAELALDDVAGSSVAWMFELLVVSLSAVCAAVGYHALRLAKEGVDVSKLVEIFA